jgi:hypothetical protein
LGRCQASSPSRRGLFDGHARELCGAVVQRPCPCCAAARLRSALPDERTDGVVDQKLVDAATAQNRCSRTVMPVRGRTSGACRQDRARRSASARV